MMATLFPVALVLIASILLWISRRRNGYWMRCGVVCQPLKPFIGVLDRLGDFNYPDVLRFRDWTAQLGKTYGIQKGWVNILITSDPQLIEEMNLKFDVFHERERLPMRANVDTEQSIHVFRARGARWRRLRSLLQPIFSIQNLKKLLPTIYDSALNMSELLEKAASENQEVNLHSYCKEYSMDLIARLVMGQEGSQQFKTDQSTVLHQTLNDNRSFLSTVSWICPPLGSLCYKIRLWKSKLTGKGISVLMSRIKAVGQRNANPDFIDFFLDAETDQVDSKANDDVLKKNSPIQKQLTTSEIVAQLKFFSIAGFDTVSATLSLVLFYLAKHPNVQDRMRQEMEDICSGNEIVYEDLKQLKFFEAVIKETLRLCPIATNAYGRTCTQTTKLGNLLIEKDTIVLVDLFSLHTDLELWGDNADEFVPERWSQGVIPKHSYFPFGGGIRICIGNMLAMMELKLALLHILRRFYILETENTGEFPVLVSNTVLNVPNVLVQLKPITG